MNRKQFQAPTNLCDWQRQELPIEGTQGAREMTGGVAGR
jgi:hypothetical protein